MKLIFFLSFLIFITIGNCISIMKIEERQTQFIHETKNKKDEIFDRALIWVSKRANDSNQSVKIKDKLEGRIIARLSNVVQVDA